MLYIIRKVFKSLPGIFLNPLQVTSGTERDLQLVVNALYCVQCTVYIVHYTVYSVQCTVYIIHCTVYSVHCTL